MTWRSNVWSIFIPFLYLWFNYKCCYRESRRYLVSRSHMLKFKTLFVQTYQILIYQRDFFARRRAKSARWISNKYETRLTSTVNRCVVMVDKRARWVPGRSRPVSAKVSHVANLYCGGSRKALCCAPRPGPLFASLHDLHRPRSLMHLALCPPWEFICFCVVLHIYSGVCHFWYHFILMLFFKHLSHLS